MGHMLNNGDFVLHPYIVLFWIDASIHLSPVRKTPDGDIGQKAKAYQQKPEWPVRGARYKSEIASMCVVNNVCDET